MTSHDNVQNTLRVLATASSSKFDVRLSPLRRNPLTPTCCHNGAAAAAAAAAAAGYTDVDYAPELQAHPPYESKLEASEGHPFYIAHYTYNVGVLSHKHSTVRSLDDSQKPKGVGLSSTTTIYCCMPLHVHQSSSVFPPQQPCAQPHWLDL